jgi:hypothetical protein
VTELVAASSADARVIITLYADWTTCPGTIEIDVKATHDGGGTA